MGERWSGLFHENYNKSKVMSEQRRRITHAVLTTGFAFEAIFNVERPCFWRDDAARL